MNRRELATVLAALRYWQRKNPGILDTEEYFEIASDGLEIDPLTMDEIDGLCERLNCGESL